MYNWLALDKDETIPLPGDIYVVSDVQLMAVDAEQKIILTIPNSDEVGLLAVKISSNEYQVTNRAIIKSLDGDFVDAAIVEEALSVSDETYIPHVYEALFASVKRMSLLKPHNLQNLDNEPNMLVKFDLLASLYLRTKEQRLKYLTSFDNQLRYNLVFREVVEKTKVHPAKLIKPKEKTTKVHTDQIPVAAKEPEVPKTFSEKILSLPFPDNVRSAVTKELERLDRLNKGSQEHAAALDYIEWAGSLPWGVYTSKNFELMDLKKQLDTSHYGLQDVKTALLEHFCIEKIRGEASGHVLCFNGPAGTGKTTIAKQIAEVSGRPLIRLALGGLSDEAELRG